MDTEKFFKKLGKMISENYGQYDTDHPKCPKCGSKMKFYGHSIDENGNEIDWEYGKGYWECKKCGFKFTENELNLYRDN